MTHPYEARILRVLDHIHENPAGDLSLDALADVAAMSRFHWHRVYHAMTGETCAETVRRIRLHRAACWLVQRDWPVAEVAERAGFGSPQSFTRIFKTGYGLTPAAFRARGTLMSPRPSPKTGDYPMFPTEVTHHPGARLAAIAHTGPYLEIGRKFEHVATLFNARNLWPHARGMAGLYYDDPAATPEAELRSHAGILVGEDFEMFEEVEEITIPAGKMAVMHYKGSYSGLMAAYQYLYGVWLPESGEEPGDSAPMEVYLNDPKEVAPEELLTDVCVPLK
ncbi:AraC family transcriptional regulator [Litoreibacter ponti]|uniref:AraC family transcriptional regulator n=1 Tax=Litoreibacter ponti TaxID=1510457 RepID=A0A2T6BMP5_9RHOB|nr:AraC family transcriptional regulator [Litoreibacter ponti]PTX57335.1 AraC family transcriptional regulator [Litoreibacter ponti]